MKKIVYTLLIIAIFCLGAIGAGGQSAFAQVSEAECDSVFIETISELMPGDGQVTVNAEKELLYDINLEPLGYLYLFDTEQSGYAIVINAFGFYECTEIYFKAENPYQEFEGLKIYVKTFTYWVFEDEVFTNVDTGLEITDEQIELLIGQAYCADSGFTYTTETVTFTSRVDNKYDLAMRVPQYYSNGAANGCVPVAGGNVITYYTRYKPNLMPGFTPGSYLGQHYLYKVLAPEIDQMVNTLKADMGTTPLGTTIPQFKTGMTKYCNDRGYSITYNSCMSGTTFNYVTAKQRIQQGQPLVVFTDPFTVSTLTVSGNNETISIMFCDAPHAMASFGYREITYTFANGQTRQDTYIQVSSGIDLRSVGFCRLDSSTTFDDAYAINIT